MINERDINQTNIDQGLKTESAELKKKALLDLESLERQLRLAKPEEEQLLGQQIISLQKRLIPEIYQGVQFENNYLTSNYTQNEDYSCQIANAANTLKALGLPGTESDIALALGKKGEVANIWPDEINEYLQSLGLKIQKVSNTLQAIELLMRGAKIILPLLPPRFPTTHSVLISGVKIGNEGIELYVNDPLYKSYPEVVQLDDIIPNIIPYSFHAITPVYAVSEP